MRIPYECWVIATLGLLGGVILGCIMVGATDHPVFSRVEDPSSVDVECTQDVGGRFASIIGMDHGDFDDTRRFGRAYGCRSVVAGLGLGCATWFG